MEETAREDNFKLLNVFTGIFVGVLVLVPSMSSKFIEVGPISVVGSTLIFPITFIFGDIFTEVYGYKRSRRVIWAGFGALVFASLMSFIITSLPDASTMSPEQVSAVNLIFGQTWRIVIASLLAFWLGEFVNSFVLAKMKVMTNGKYLWMRTIGSTFAGEAVDSVIFYPLAFLGTWSNAQVISVMIGNYFIKVFWEVLATPLTYKIVSFLKRAEHEDYFDRGTDFNPFTLDA